MIGTRFSTVGWTGCVCAAALAFYLVSQTVAAKRAEVIAVDRKIVATQRQIAQLETEISTRGGMAQIENWNSRVYGLQAPGAEQFVHSSVQLVAMADPQPLPLDPAINGPRKLVQQTSLTVPAADATPDKAIDTPEAAPVAVGRPMLRQATYVEPRRTGMMPDAPGVEKTSLVNVDIDAEAAKPAIVKPAPKLPAPKAEPKMAKAEGKAKTETRPAKAESKVVKAEAKAPAKDTKVAKVKEARPAKPTKMTALDDNWLADVTTDPAAKRSHKGRP